MTSAYSFLRQVSLFSDLSDVDLEKICKETKEVHLRSGEILFEERSLGQHAYVIREGQIEIYTQSNGREVLLAVRKPGEMIGELSLLKSIPRNASGRALTDSLLYAIGQEQFNNLINSSPSAARTMLHTVLDRMRTLDLALNQSEKLAQLGTLTAGIAHELNNPASAVKRGAEQFKAAFPDLQAQLIALSEANLSSSQLRALLDLTARANPPAYLDPIERHDREDSFEEWLEGLGIADSWEKAPLLVNLGYGPETLKQALAGFPEGSLPAILDWIASSAALASISNEISQGASRISEIIKALKSYVYLDQAPVQEVSIHEGLENTLVILMHKLKHGIQVERIYDPALPPILAYASELNQVWTNIIDNAIDAMEGQGKITIRTTYKPPWVFVDIADTGPGIPPENQNRLFTPFFTTKAFGKGTGLGLSISYNIIQKHGGDIHVTSQPGETHFEVQLPEDFQKSRS